MKKQEGYQVKEREHFDALVESIGETFWANKTPAGIERLRRKAGLAADWVGAMGDPLVLEIGCGTGIFSEYLLERRPGTRLVGYDISPAAIRHANDRCARFPNARFEVADVLSREYPAGAFDAVIGLAILHHLPIDRAVATCHDALKPGGGIWFTEPNMMNPIIAAEKNIRFIGERMQSTEDETAFFRWSLARKLRDSGFADVSVQPYDFLLPMVPRSLVGAVDRLGRLLEWVPAAREIAGNLLITARKAPATDRVPPK